MFLLENIKKLKLFRIQSLNNFSYKDIFQFLVSFSSPIKKPENIIVKIILQNKPIYKESKFINLKISNKI